MRFSLPIVVAIALALAPAAALAQWQDNFDAYPVGPLVPQGGWTGWNGDPNATAYVVTNPNRSAPNSAEIRPTSDCVQQFANVNSGQWIISAWAYVPAGIAGDQYFILLNTYPAAANNNWSCQVQFNMTTGVCLDADNPNGPTLPLVRGQWTEVRVEINFNTDQQSIYYNGALLNQKSWTAGTAPGGALRLQALDLFSNLAPAIYWDDCVLRQAGPTPVEPTSWGAIKANFR